MGYNDIYRIAALIVKDIKGDLTDEEREQLHSWRNASDRNSQLYEKYQEAAFFKARSVLNEEPSSERIRKGLKEKIARRRKQTILWRTASYAAGFLLILSIGTALFLHSDFYQSPWSDMKAIKAGDSKAILSLYDGSEYCLDSQTRLALIEDSYAIKDKTGTYLLDKEKQKTKSENKLFVPRNGKYEITLCDGTKVWLNSDSELFYPSTFSSHERVVRASGEMYFEVAHHDNWPFIIETHYGKVEVKGTSFNLRSYKEEGKLYTTLVQGKVLISANEKEEEVELHPGETAVISDNQNINIVPMNVNEAISWKNDMFVFHSSTLEEIMEAAARWYDIQVVWLSGDRKHILFSGELPRSKDFADFVQMIELTGKVRFSVKGRTVYIDKTS